MPYSAGMSNCYDQRVEFLRPLSMTCRAMRLRLLPWVWERLEIPQRLVTASKKLIAQRLSTILDGPRTGAFLATNVKYLYSLLCPLDRRSFCLLPRRFVKVHGPLLQFFVKCLELLPNLHTLEIWANSIMTTPLEKALKRVKLPQIRTLILPPAAHPILRHCHNVEDIIYKVSKLTWPFDGSPESLESNQKSQVKRLAIPLHLWPNSFRE